MRGASKTRSVDRPQSGLLRVTSSSEEEDEYEVATKRTSPLKKPSSAGATRPYSHRSSDAREEEEEEEESQQELLARAKHVLTLQKAEINELRAEIQRLKSAALSVSVPAVTTTLTSPLRDSLREEVAKRQAAESREQAWRAASGCRDPDELRENLSKRELRTSRAESNLTEAWKKLERLEERWLAPQPAAAAAAQPRVLPIVYSPARETSNGHAPYSAGSATKPLVFPSSPQKSELGERATPTPAPSAASASMSAFQAIRSGLDEVLLQS